MSVPHLLGTVFLVTVSGQRHAVVDGGARPSWFAGHPWIDRGWVHGYRM